MGAACAQQGHRDDDSESEISDLESELTEERAGLWQTVTEYFARWGQKKGIKVQLPHNEGKRIEDSIDLDRRQLGSGSFGTVCKGKDKHTGVGYAVKCIHKEKTCQIIQREALEREIRVMTKLDHPNILKMFETFQDKQYVYLVLEMCEGGELLDRIVEEKHLPESDAAGVMQQVFHAIRYTHAMDIIHKDLKPENLMLLHKGAIQGNCVKVIDFGIAAEWKGRMLKLKSGTLDYEAPELIELMLGNGGGGYDKEVDAWSCGVILYVMLSGFLPFQDNDSLETMVKIKAGTLTWRGFGGVSASAKDLIQHLLTVDKDERVTMKQALKHPWIVHGAPHASPVGCTQAIENLRQFSHANKLKKEAFHLLARDMDEGKMEQLRDTFEKFDTNGDGTLSLHELHAGLKHAGVTDAETLHSLASALDRNYSGSIDYSEFLAATMDHRAASQEAVCWSAFRVFDINDDGVISKTELKKVLDSRDVQHLLGEEAIKTIMDEVDVDGDGVINFDEFMKMLKK